MPFFPAPTKTLLVLPCLDGYKVFSLTSPQKEPNNFNLEITFHKMKS